MTSVIFQNVTTAQVQCTDHVIDQHAASAAQETRLLPCCAASAVKTDAVPFIGQ